MPDIIVNYPIIDEVLLFFIILTEAAFIAIIMHPIFKIYHGTGKWRDTLLGQTISYGLVLPFVFIFKSILSRFIDTDALYKLHYEGLYMVYAIPVFSAMHQISLKKTSQVIIIGLIISFLFLFGFFLLIFFFDASH